MSANRKVIAGSLILLMPSLVVQAFASRSHSSSSSDSTLFTVIAVGGFALLMLFINASKKPKPITEDESNRMVQEAEDWYHAAASGSLVPPNTLVILRPGEHAILEEGSTLAEARAVRVYGGGGTRIHGIYIGGGESTSFDQLKNIDSGSVTLTDQRLIFSGQLQQRVIAISDIVSARPYGGAAFVVSSQKRGKAQVYSVSNPIVWTFAIQMVVKGDLHLGNTARPAPKVVQPAEEPAIQPRATKAQMAYLSDLGVQFDPQELNRGDASRLIGQALAVNTPSKAQLSKLDSLGFILKDDEKFTYMELDQVLALTNRNASLHDLEKLHELKINLENSDALSCRILIELDDAFQADEDFIHLGTVGIAKACAAAASDPDLFKPTLRHDKTHKELTFSWPKAKLKEWASKVN